MDQREQQLYKKHYGQLTADQLMLAVIDEHIIAYPSKPGPWAYDSLKADLPIAGGVKVPGLIWRDQETHRERPEPKEEYQAISEELLRTKGKLRKQYADSILKGLPRYIEYRPLIVKRINELALPVLYGKREDTQALVREYQAGHREALPRIKNQLGGIVHIVQDRFMKKVTSGKAGVFTDLAGKINKKLKKPERIYSEKSPAGGGEDPRLFLTMEPFRFMEEDINALVDNSLIEALGSYRFGYGRQFKSWFYDIFDKDLHDLYDEYQHGWKYGHIIKSIEELEAALQEKVIPKIEFATVADCLAPEFMEKLNLNQRRWIALFLKMLPDSLRDKLTAEYMGISERTENRTRRALQDLIISENPIFKLKKYRNIEVRERQKRPPLTAQPPLTGRQKMMIANHNEFIKSGPVIKYRLANNGIMSAISE